MQVLNVKLTYQIFWQMHTTLQGVEATWGQIAVQVEQYSKLSTFPDVKLYFTNNCYKLRNIYRKQNKTKKSGTVADFF